jgi:hypothetical protein
MAYTDIDKPSDYFNTKLYSGNSSTQSLTGVNFQPDFTWIKERNGVEHHYLFDAVRGVTKFIYTNLTNGEASNANSLTAFDSDGFSLGNYDDVNESGKTYASWNWLASNTTASNTDGSITSTVSANTTSGFSIVSYTGTGSLATVGHGLGTTPSMIIIKKRNDAEDWMVYHKSLTATNYIKLNLTDQTFANSVVWNNTEPTSSFFTIATSGAVNISSATYIAYCFAEKKGFSAMGQYTGNTSADGTFVYLGFRPAFVLIKRSNGSVNWYIFDNKRDSFNVMSKELNPNLGSAEGTELGANPIDFLSNGFKLRVADSYINATGDPYIYMAFAENPFVTSTGIPTPAR